MMNTSFSIVDIEVTEEKEIIQIAILSLDKNLKIIDKYNRYCKSKNNISSFLTNLTGITDNMLLKQEYFLNIAEEVYDRIKDTVLICHGVIQDYSILKEELLNSGINYVPKDMLDTVELCKIFFPKLDSYKLADILSSFNIFLEGEYHRADNDVLATYRLLFEILKKVGSLQDNNYLKIIEILRHYSLSSYKFLSRYRKNFYISNTDIDKNLFYSRGVYFKKITINKKESNFKNKIYVSSIPEERYVSINLSDNIDSYYILKEHTEYIDVNFLETIVNKNYDLTNKNNQLLYMKILVWILETEKGYFSELNLDNIEKNNIDIYRSLNKKQSYYYNKALTLSKNSSAIITNYKSFLNIILEDKFKDCVLVFEDENILTLEIRKMFAKNLSYKDVIVELNIAYSKFNDLKIKKIKDNIDEIIKYIHKIYLKKNDNLYNDMIGYILQDIVIIYDKLKNLKYNLKLTSLFLSKLFSILKFRSKGYYKFEILSSYNSFYLKYNNPKKENIVMANLISKNVTYLKNYKLFTELEMKNRNYNDFNSKNTCVNKLYLFKGDNNKDVAYSLRDKKGSIKYKNYSYYDNFYNIFKDIEKNYKLSYICYADSSIMYYKKYLEILFVEVYEIDK